MSRLTLTSLVFLLVLVSAKPQEAFSCSVERVEGISPNNTPHRTTYMCESSCATYFLTGDVKAFLEEKEIYLELGAQQRLVVPRSAVENGSIDVDKHGSTIDVAPMWNAIAALATNAPRKLLVVRVESEETSPEVNETQLKYAYFEKPNSVKNFFAKCSKNSQIVIPAGKTNNTGVVTVTYPGKTRICNGHVGYIKQRETQENIWGMGKSFDNLVSQYEYTNVVWIYPDCVWFGGAAGWGSRPGKDVWIPSGYSLTPIVMVHEFGHNLGLGHSGENGVPYGDSTGYMGNMGGISGGWSEDGLDTCFNAAKMWQLGWYPKYGESYAPFQWSSPNEITVDLVGYNDVVTDQISANQRALVEIKGGQFDSLYIMYNVPEGIVKEVPVHKNLVHIVAGQKYGRSDFQEALSTGQTFNYNGVVIKVQTMKNGVATILIKKPSSPPTSRPTTKQPTSPTKQPTKSCPACQLSQKGVLTCCKGGWKGKCADSPTAAKPYTWEQGKEVCKIGNPKCSQCGLSDRGFLTCCLGAWKDNCGKGKDHSWIEGFDACKEQCTCAENSNGVLTCCAGGPVNLRGSWYNKCADPPTSTRPYTWKEGKAQCRVNNAVAYAALDIPKEASSDSDAETDYPSLLDDKCDNDTTNKTSETTTKGAISSPISSPLVSSSFPVEPAFLLSLSLFTLY